MYTYVYKGGKMGKTIRLTDETHQRFIEAKGEMSADTFINTLLRGTPPKKIEEAKLDAIIYGIEEIKDLLMSDEEKDSEYKNLEKNNSLATPKIEEPRGRRPAGVELPCCSGTSPCKHWIYDGLNAKWTNTLSGEEREEQL